MVVCWCVIVFLVFWMVIQRFLIFFGILLFLIGFRVCISFVVCILICILLFVCVCVCRRSIVWWMDIYDMLGLLYILFISTFNSSIPILSLILILMILLYIMVENMGMKKIGIGQKLKSLHFQHSISMNVFL